MVWQIKEITPETALSPSTARFFKQDLKIARQYNQDKSKGQTLEGLSGEDVGQEILQEWVDATGLNAHQIMSGDSAEAKAIQEQTLADIMADVQNDQVFQLVKRGSISINPVAADLMSTLSLQRLSPSTPFQSRRPTLVPASRSPGNGSFNSLVLDTNGTSLIDMNGVTSNRRKSSALRQTLATSEHLPYSVWPKARTSRFNVHPATLEVPSTTPSILLTPDLAKYRRMSKTALTSYIEEMKRQSDVKEEETCTTSATCKSTKQSK